MERNFKDMDLVELGNEMFRQRFSMDSGHMSTIFQDISVPDYLILSNLANRMGIHEPEAKIYLSRISQELELPITRVSRIVQNLQSKGYVYWEHDSSGTYIYLSETGREVMARQQEILKTFFGNVAERIGREELVRTLEDMIELEEAMELEAEKFE